MTDQTPLPSSAAAFDEDVEIGRLLHEAYDAPPMSKAFLRRLERELVATRPMPDRPPRPARFKTWLRATPIALGLAILFALWGIFGREAPAYAWASMLSALEQRGFIQLQGPGVTRWLSLAEGVIGEESATGVTLVNLPQGWAYQRPASATTVQRTRSEVPSQTNHDALVLAFLAGDTPDSIRSSVTKPPRILKERWERTVTAGHPTVRLHVEFDRSPQPPLQLTVLLDPETKLPRQSSLDQPGGNVPVYSVSYPDATRAAWQAERFPSELAIVDVLPLPNGPLTSPARVASSNDQIVIAQAFPAWHVPEAVTLQPVPAMVGRLNTQWETVWNAQGVTPVAAADDAELLRRVYLDLLGRTPTVTEVRQYLQKTDPLRYERLVDQILQSPEHATHLATVWRNYLIPEGIDLTAFGGVDTFDRWLADRFGPNRPYDETVRELLLAEGRLAKSGPLLFYAAAKLDPEILAARTSRVFLGIRLECAQCHQHPFEHWSQLDFWGFAAFFARISRPQGELMAASTVLQVRDVDRGEVKLPNTETLVAPKYLDGTPLPTNVDEQVRRRQLAQWVTSARNPYFARATANRVWGMLFGRGIVDPLDDFGAQHPAKSQQALDLLAERFAQTEFDLRDLLRIIVLSRPYRLSSQSESDAPQQREWFAQMSVKTLTAEQLYDSIAAATLLERNATFDVQSQLAQPARAEFVQLFRTPTDSRTTYLGGIPQALTLMNGSLIDSATGLASSGVLKSLEAPFFTNEQRIEILYFATLARRPLPTEQHVLSKYITEKTRGPELQEALADLLWALLNSAEFAMNH